MSWIGVITGDIVNSSEILKAGQRDKLLDVMHQTIRNLNADENWGNIQLEVYRGDSFQIIAQEVRDTLGVAVALRAKLIATSTKDLRWDARLGVGIGNGEYLADKISESDGEAFHLSGEAFDKLDKNSRLQILTPNKDYNEELEVSTAFVDDIVTNWTIAQAETFYLTITSNETQKGIALLTKKTPQTISKILAAGKFQLIANYYARFFKKIKNIQP